MYAKEIAQVRDTERKMVDARDREKRQFEDQERANQKKIA
jgi:hypothetical protein